MSRGVFGKNVVGVEDQSHCVLWDSGIGTFSCGCKVFDGMLWA